MTGKIIVGHCLDVLRELPAESWHCCVTSPPYWGLRFYGTEPVVWGGDRACAHVWGDELVLHQRGKRGERSTLDGGAPHRQQKVGQGQWCQRCGAWRGELGLEPSIDLYIAHLVEVFREVRRVLRKDGTLWLNVGDSYAGANWRGGGTNTTSSKQLSNGGTRPMMGQTMPFIPEGLKPKDLCLIPERLALALQQDGWWIRSKIIWHKPNCMPESVGDRPTRDYETILLCSKQANYAYDAQAIAEPKSVSTRRDGRDNGEGQRRERGYPGDPSMGGTNLGGPEGKRNARSVWDIANQPYHGAHFAVMAAAVAERCILAGTGERGCCPECGAPWERVLSTARGDGEGWRPTCGCYNERYATSFPLPRHPRKWWHRYLWREGWMARVRRRGAPSDWPTAPCVVGDPFGGAGTTAKVALEHGRDYVLIEIKPEYARLAEERVNGVQGRML